MSFCDRCGIHEKYNEKRNSCLGCGDPRGQEQTSQKIDRIIYELERYRRVNNQDIDFLVSILKTAFQPIVRQD